MKIDIFNHFFPPTFFAKLEELLPKAPIERWKLYQPLFDVNARLRQCEEFGDYQQVPCISQPPIEALGGPDESPAIARLANDGLAKICRDHPDRFPSFIATLPMNNPDAAIAEAERCAGELGAGGVQIYTNVNGKPLDAPEFFPVFERLAQLGIGVWLHPTRPPSFADYQAEPKSRYEIWWLFGWDYEISAAMSRLVFSLMFEKLPNLKVLAHHMGAYVPQAAGRIDPHMEEFGLRTFDEDYSPILEAMTKKPVEYFKMFHADTALFGSRAATVNGLDFFGTDMCVFASDAPFDREGGSMLIRDTIRVVDSLDISEAERTKIYETNPKALLGLK